MRTKLLRSFKALHGLIITLALTTALLPLTAEAGQGFKHGVVMSRAVVLDEETQQPILVEFAEDGTEAGLVSVPEQYRNAIESLKIISASEYRFHENRLEQYLQLHANDLALGAEVMDKAQFDSTVFKTADGEHDIDHAGDIDTWGEEQNIKSVLVRGQSNRLLNNPNELILLAFPVNLAQAAIVNDDDRSIVLT